MNVDVEQIWLSLPPGCIFEDYSVYSSYRSLYECMNIQVSHFQLTHHAKHSS